MLNSKPGAVISLMASSAELCRWVEADTVRSLPTGPLWSRPPCCAHAFDSHSRSAGVRGCAPRAHKSIMRPSRQGCGDMPRVLPVDVCCAAPRCAGSLAQVQWIPMMLTSEASDPRTHVPRRDAHAPGARAPLLTLRRCLFSSCECACRAPTEGPAELRA